MPGEADNNVVFYLLVPTKRNIAVIDRMAVNEGIGKPIIKGHKDDVNCYVWFNFVKISRQVVLKDIYKGWQVGVGGNMSD